MVSVWRCVVRLTALAFFLHQGEPTMKHIMRTFPLPTVLQVPLTDVGLVEKAVMIDIVMAEIVLIMCQHFRTQLVVQMDVGIDIGLQTS